MAWKFGYLSQGHIYDIEVGKRRPTLELAIKVSNYFGVSIDALVKDAEEVDVGE
jgi:DNA-binding XRE family transcriptional regulator